MALEDAVRTYTLAGGDVAALVGARMHPRHLPQNPTLPALVYTRVDTRRLHDLAGADGLPRTRLQITCWANLPAGAAHLAAVVRTRLDSFRGVMGGENIGACLCVGERDLEDAEAGRSGVALDFMIHYQEE
jgi:hypothetical protein